MTFQADLRSACNDTKSPGARGGNPKCPRRMIADWSDYPMKKVSRNTFRFCSNQNARGSDLTSCLCKNNEEE